MSLIDKGKRKYVMKIDALGGAQAYYACGKRGGIHVAECLKELKAAKGSTAQWGEAWAAAMA